MNFLDQIPRLTSKIEVRSSEGRISVGTGFFFEFRNPEKGSCISLITNKHVVSGGIQAKICISLKDEKGIATGKHEVTLIQRFQELIVEHPDPAVDLAIFPVGGILNQMTEDGSEPYLHAFSYDDLVSEEQEKSLTAIENILMIGYPTGIWDAANNLPVIRRGITATPYYHNYNGRSEFLIDCACFPGSSGSPVVIADSGSYPTKDGRIMSGNRFHLLGLLWGGPQYNAEGTIVARPVPTSTEAMAVSSIPTNLGFCIKAKLIRDLEPLLLERP